MVTGSKRGYKVEVTINSLKRSDSISLLVAETSPKHSGQIGKKPLKRADKRSTKTTEGGDDLEMQWSEGGGSVGFYGRHDGGWRGHARSSTCVTRGAAVLQEKGVSQGGGHLVWSQGIPEPVCVA